MKSKKIKKLELTGLWHGVAFVDENKILIALFQKINEIIDKLNKK